MKFNEWKSLKHGDKIKNKYNGDIEKIYEAFDEKYIEGEKSLFPLSEFDCEDWEKLNDANVTKKIYKTYFVKEMNAYRLYDPDYPQQTIAYFDADELEKTKKRVADELSGELVIEN